MSEKEESSNEDNIAPSRVAFDPEWEQLYFFTEYFGLVRCLICLKDVHNATVNTIRRHYFSLHAEQCSSLQKEERIAAIEKLKADPCTFMSSINQPTFNPEWEELYFFVDYEGQPRCLVCFKTLYVKKKYNIKRHYSLKHAQKYELLDKEERLALLEKLKAKFYAHTLREKLKGKLLGLGTSHSLITERQASFEKGTCNVESGNMQQVNSESITVDNVECEDLKNTENIDAQVCIAKIEDIKKEEPDSEIEDSEQGEHSNVNETGSLEDEEESMNCSEPPIGQTEDEIEKSLSIPKFNSVWEEEYFFTEDKGLPRCLVCLKILQTKRKYNVQRHYSAYHSRQYETLTKEERFAEVENLKSKLLNVNQTPDNVQEKEISEEISDTKLPDTETVAVEEKCEKEDSNSLSVLKFNPQWEKRYFFTEEEGVPKCLICSKTIPAKKKSLIERHYTIWHAQEYDLLTDEKRTSELAFLKSKLPPTIHKSNPKCEYYFFVEIDGIAKCLICFKVLCTLKKYNLERHFSHLHGKKYEKLSREERRIEVQKLKAEFFAPTREVPVSRYNIKKEIEDCDETKPIFNESGDLVVKQEATFEMQLWEGESSELLTGNQNEQLTADESRELSQGEKHDNPTTPDESGEVSDGENHYCKVCCKSFCSDSELLAHEYEHTGEQTYSRSISYIPFSQSGRKENSNGDPEFYSCRYCDELFKYKAQYSAHLRLHVGTSLTCQICNKSFPRRSSLMRHAKVHEFTKPNKLHTCEFCNKTFDSKSHFTVHLRLHTFTKREYNCAVCNKGFFQKSDLKKHEGIHSGVRPYPCDYCSKAFLRKHEYIIHTRIHTGNRPFLCEYCGKTFSHKNALFVHLRYHNGDKRYVCDVCNKAFYRKGGLSEHMHTHTGSRPYSCGICKKTFNRKANLVCHKLIHKGEKSFVCVVCNFAFSQRRNLKKHMLTHTGNPA